MPARKYIKVAGKRKLVRGLRMCFVGCVLPYSVDKKVFGKLVDGAGIIVVRDPRKIKHGVDAAVIGDHLERAYKSQIEISERRIPTLSMTDLHRMVGLGVEHLPERTGEEIRCMVCTGLKDKADFGRSDRRCCMCGAILVTTTSAGLEPSYYQLRDDLRDVGNDVRKLPPDKWCVSNAMKAYMDIFGVTDPIAAEESR